MESTREEALRQQRFRALDAWLKSVRAEHINTAQFPTCEIWRYQVARGVCILIEVHVPTGYWEIFLSAHESKNPKNVPQCPEKLTKEVA